MMTISILDSLTLSYQKWVEHSLLETTAETIIGYYTAILSRQYSSSLRIHIASIQSQSLLDF